MIDEKLLSMIDDYRLNTRGVPASFSYKMRKRAYEAAEAAMAKARRGVADVKVTKAIGALGFMAFMASNAQLASNMINEPEHVHMAKLKFLQQYRVALSKAGRGALTDKDKRFLFDALMQYLTVLGMSEQYLGSVRVAFEAGMAGRGD